MVMIVTDEFCRVAGGAKRRRDCRPVARVPSATHTL